MYTVCVVTATRAEYGLLRPLLYRLRDCNKVDLRLVVTGTHLIERFGNTQTEIIADGFSNYEAVSLPLEDDSKRGMAVATGVATQKFALLFAAMQPNVVVVLGDRFEMLGVATAAHLQGIPIAHLCGGDVTEGAVDDAIRHCLTKLSYLHFAGCAQSAQRIIQLGEDPSRVFNVGEPGIENCLNMDLLDAADLAKQYDFAGFLGDYCVVTFHPVTMENNTGAEQLSSLIRAMDSFPNMSYVITKANADAGGRQINDLWDKEAATRSNWLVVTSLGMLRYISSVKHAKLVLGNSSSGLVEAPAFGVPTINIGDRQKGRMMAQSVICCEPTASSICSAMARGLSQEFRDSIRTMDLPFGDGTTSQQVMDAIVAFLKTHTGATEKKFYDLPAR